MSVAPEVEPKHATTDEPPLLHLVLKSEWPQALCGVTVGQRHTNKAAGCDRCPECLRLAAARGLGRPVWV
jgi:hypothetical protein